MSLKRYIELLQLPHVPRIVIAALVGRLPVGMTTLAIVLFVAEQTGSFARAGLAAGAFALANGIATPLQSRLIDRLGPSRVHFICVGGEHCARRAHDRR